MAKQIEGKSIKVDGSSVKVNVSGQLYSPGSGGAACMGYSFQKDGGNPYLTFSTTSYSAIANILWPGTDSVGIPSSIKIVIGKSSGGDYDFRIYDVTNGQTICEITGQSDLYPAIKDMGSISNLSAGAARWELQAKKVSGDSGFFANCNIMF